MAYTVHVKPSDHEFIVAQDETILEAGLRFGLSMQCSCTNGTCGKCKARVLSGDITKVLHHDYVLSEQEKASGTVLLCRVNAGSDLVIEAVEATGVSDIPFQQLTAKVSKIELITDDVMILEMRTPRSQTLQFLAGQYVTLSIDSAPPRSKPIASCPCNGMVLQFHIQNTPGDAFAEFVFSDLKVRQSVSVTGPLGQFVLDEESCRPILFIAYETGFAPIKSVIEHAIALEFEQTMRLYWIVRDEADHYQANYCRSWQGALDDFVFTPLISDAASMPAPNDVETEQSTEVLVAQSGLLQAVRAVIADYSDLSGFDLYINGPPDIAAPAVELLLKHKLPPDRLFIEDLGKC